MDMFQIKSDTEQECKRVRHHQEVDRHTDRQRQRKRQLETLSYHHNHDAPITEPEKPALTRGRAM